MAFIIHSARRTLIISLLSRPQMDGWMTWLWPGQNLHIFCSKIRTMPIFAGDFRFFAKHLRHLSLGEEKMKRRPTNPVTAGFLPVTHEKVPASLKEFLWSRRIIWIRLAENLGSACHEFQVWPFYSLLRTYTTTMRLYLPPVACEVRKFTEWGEHCPHYWWQ